MTIFECKILIAPLNSSNEICSCVHNYNENIHKLCSDFKQSANIDTQLSIIENANELYNTTKKKIDTIQHTETLMNYIRTQVNN